MILNEFVEVDCGVGRKRDRTSFTEIFTRIPISIFSDLVRRCRQAFGDLAWSSYCVCAPFLVEWSVWPGDSVGWYWSEWDVVYKRMFVEYPDLEDDYPGLRNAVPIRSPGDPNRTIMFKRTHIPGGEIDERLREALQRELLPLGIRRVQIGLGS